MDGECGTEGAEGEEGMTKPDKQTARSRHPCAGRSAAQIETFEAIATSQKPPFRPSAIKALLRAGLIEQIGEKVLGRDALGPIKVPVYEVPLPVHYQWCQWCAENVEE
jgi:hypothetical protein